MCEQLRGWSRRDFVKDGSAAFAGALALPAVFRLPTAGDLRAAERPNLEIALEAWRWLETARMATDLGVTWPADPLEPESVGPTLYTHAPGVVVFALELFYHTGDEAYLAVARAGADDLVRYLDVETIGSGLYTGLTGLAFVFEEVYRAGGGPRYRELSERVTGHVIDTASPAGTGLAWPVERDGETLEVTDIVSGASGAGLALLYLHARMNHPGALEAATGLGTRLVEKAEPVETGRKWQIFEGFPREMPNFSHGTAGVAYYLATLSAATGRGEFLEAAVEGARYLQSIATVENDGYRIFHHTPAGEDLYYLSWCHGPAGTNRLFFRLWEATGEPEWLEWMHMGARGIIGEGVPERRTPGFWENISQCGGNAGLGEFFLAFHRMTGEPAYRRYVDRLNTDLLARSIPEAGGLKWTQSEHRVQPDLVVAQTGFMQGAAGVGKYYLHVDAMAQRGGAPAIILPDAPY